MKRRLPAVGLVLMFLGAAIPASAGATETLPPAYFAPAVTYAVGNDPSSVAVGDFGNGHLDLAVTNYDDNTVSVLLGNGDGTFQPQVTYPVGIGPTSVAIGDFGNGHLDLAVANSQSNSVSVLMGNGDGTFTAGQTITGIKYEPISIAVGRFAGSGDPLGLVVADEASQASASGNVTMLLGNGDGTFQTPVTYSVPMVPTTPGGLTVGDFNGDGYPDIAVTGDDTSGGNSTVEVLLNAADGTGDLQEAPGSPIAIIGAAYSITDGDFTGSGDPLDLAVSTSNESSVAVLDGQGDGSFDPLTTVYVGAQPESVVAADFNGDGNLDLATANAFDNTVTAPLNLGDGTFQQDGPAPSPVGTLPVGNDPGTLAVGDFNGDGQPDIVAANQTDGTVSVLLSAPTADASPMSLAFGSSTSPVAQGASSAPQDVTITNNGTAPLTITGISVTGSNSSDFVVGSDACQGSVAIYASCTIPVTFSPTTQGAESATLSVTSNAPASPSTVELTGTAGPPSQSSSGGSPSTPGAPGSPTGTVSSGSTGSAGQPTATTVTTPQPPAAKKQIAKLRATCKLGAGRRRLVCRVVLTNISTAGRAVHASLTHGPSTLATAVLHGHSLVMNSRRKLRSGRYTLTVKVGQGRSATSIHETIKVA